MQDGGLEDVTDCCGKSEMVEKANETIGITREQNREHLFGAFMPPPTFMARLHLCWAQAGLFCFEKE